MAREQRIIINKGVGSGTNEEFSAEPIRDAKCYYPPNGEDRDNFTKSTYTTACEKPTYAPGSAGGSEKRFNELRSHVWGKQAGEPFDSDYAIVDTVQPPKHGVPNVKRNED